MKTRCSNIIILLFLLSIKAFYKDENKKKRSQAKLKKEKKFQSLCVVIIIIIHKGTLSELIFLNLSLLRTMSHIHCLHLYDSVFCYNYNEICFGYIHDWIIIIYFSLWGTGCLSNPFQPFILFYQFRFILFFVLLFIFLLW